MPSRGLLDGATAPRRHRRGAAREGAPRRRAGCAAGCVAAPLQQLVRRGAARRRARAQAVDGWTAVYDQDGRPRAMPDELVGVPANRCCALQRQHDEPPYTHCSHKHTTSATRRPAREKRMAHFKFVCDGAPSNCAEPGSRRGRRHGLQLDGDGAASRRRYGGGRVYMELTIDGRARRPAQRGSFDIKAPRPGSVCNTASIIRDARAPRNNPRAGTTRGTTSSHLGILGSNKPHLVGPLGHRLVGSGLTIGV